MTPETAILSSSIGLVHELCFRIPTPQRSALSKKQFCAKLQTTWDLEICLDPYLQTCTDELQPG